jgi:tRNA(fMet)-specific endonuclease VapC
MNNDDTLLLLDANVILYLLNGDEKVHPIIHQKTVAINFIVEIELLSWPSLNKKSIEAITGIIKEARCFDYSYQLKEYTIRLRQQYKLKLADAFIASTALTYDLTLISADKVFSKIPSIKFINFTPSVAQT